MKTLSKCPVCGKTFWFSAGHSCCEDCEEKGYTVDIFTGKINHPKEKK